jgi:nucleoid-associated protein YgaU
MLGTAGGLLGGWGALTMVLSWAMPEPLAALGQLRDGVLPPPDVLAGVLAGGLAWLVATVVAGLGLLGLLAAAPGLARHAVGAAAARMTPELVRRTVTGMLGLSVGLPLAGATAAGATTSITPPTPWAAVGSGAVGSFIADRPAAAPTPPPAPLPELRQVVVRPGDTLWDLVAAELGGEATDSQIAAEWPRWYAANRSQIGPDPGRLYPGQRLVVPPPA